MQSPKDTIYIQDRKKLEKIDGLTCNDTNVTFNYKSKAGENIYISISNTKYLAANHTLLLLDTVYKFIHNQKKIDHLISKNIIDGKPAYGIDGGPPTFEISELKINWNYSWLIIPDSSFHNLYQTHLGTVEAYITKNNQLLYLYISASDSAGSYSVKIVFNRKKYLTRIVNRNEMTNGYDFLDAITKSEIFYEDTFNN